MSNCEESETRAENAMLTSPMATAPVLTTGGSGLGRSDMAESTGEREEKSGEFDNELKTWTPWKNTIGAELIPKFAILIEKWILKHLSNYKFKEETLAPA